MADIAITTYTNKTYKNGASTVVPGFVEGSPGSPVNPPGSGGASEFVPYVGANQNVNLGEFGLSTGFITLDTTPTNTPTTQGTFYWDEDDNTVDIILNGYIMKVGEDLFYPVKNQTGSSIPKGTNVRFAGTVGGSGRLLIEPYLADGTYATSRYMGVTAETIGNGEDGKVLWFGRIRGINTNAYNEGDVLYASTSSAGGFQTTLPVAPNNIVEVCAVVTKSVNNGVIFVRPQFLSSGSKWTDVGSGNIYRNSRVRIGSTVDPTRTLSVTGDFISDTTSSGSIVNSGTFNLLAGYTGSARTDAIIGTNQALGTGQNLNTPALNIGGSFASIGSTSGYNVGLRGVAFGSTSNNIGFYGDATTVVSGNNIGFFARAGNSSDRNVAGFLTNNLSATIPTIAKNCLLALETTNLPYLVCQNTGTSGFEITSNFDFSFLAINGTKIGTTTSQKLGFWNATPIIQPTTGIAESAFLENSGGVNINDDSTFDGYTLRQVVKALRDAGLLA
jgi:hypothetical protein